MNVAPQTVELGDCDCTMPLARLRKRSGELGPPVQGIGTIAGLDIDALPHNLEILVNCETGKSLALGVQPEPVPFLSFPYPAIGDDGPWARTARGFSRDDEVGLSFSIVSP
jgi:hypothetical protein